MNQHSGLPMRASLVAALVALLSTSPAWAEFDSGSSGADGVLSPTVNTEIELPESGILNYTTVNIPAGVTVEFKRNVANTPVYMLVSGDATIAGTINIAGLDATATGTYGDGAQGDDGIPGQGGPGGFDGGRGGRDDTAQRAAVIRGGPGLGPGGGPGGIEGSDGCSSVYGYYKHRGVGGAYASTVTPYGCGSTTTWSAPAYGSDLLQPLVGGSGGGGGRGGTNYPGSGGGGGGGALLLAASGTLRLTGSINARGGDGGGLSGSNAGGQGAGGSGGAVRLMASRVEGNGSLLAEGGCINLNGNRRQNCGFTGGGNHQGGSPGRIRIEGEAVTFSGSSTPTYVRGDIAPVFLADAPSLRIVSVAGQAVPASPTGINDITLPATTTDPVAVVLETVNVPVGNTVQVKVVPAYGTANEVASPAITGTDALGGTQVSVTLPQGPSTMQATTTYTVVVATLDDPALSERLNRLAGQGQVEKVEVSVSLHGAAQATLLTDEGESFEMPYAALSAIGFKG